MAPAAEAANPVLTIQGLGSKGTDVTAFVDKVEIIRASDGTVVSGAVGNLSYETYGPLNFGNFGYGPVAAPWTFSPANRAGIAQNGSNFGAPTAPDGIAVAFVQSFGGSSGSLQQTLTLPDGLYKVRFQVAQRAYGSAQDQALNVLVNGALVGNIKPTNTASFATFTSNAFAVDSPNNALAFDGVNDYVHGTSTLPATGEFTLEGWVNPTAYGGSFNAFVLSDNFPAGAMHSQFEGSNGYGMEFTVNGNIPTDVHTSLKPALGQWSHIAVVYSASAKTVKFYLNGTLFTSASYTTAVSVAALPYSLGGWLNGGTPDRLFNGKFDARCASTTRRSRRPRFRPTCSARPRPCPPTSKPTTILTKARPGAITRARPRSPTKAATATRAL